MGACSHTATASRRTPNLFPNPKRDRAPQPRERETEDDIRAHVDQRIDRLAVAEQVQRVIAERGKGGEAAQHADEYQRPRLWRERAARFRQLAEKPDHETADEIDRQRAEGKVNAFARRLNPCAEQIAGNRSHRATESDERNCN